MARVFIDGFESGGLGSWDFFQSGTPTLSTGIGGMDGTYCVYCNTVGLHKNLPTLSEIYVSLRWRPDSSAANSIVAFFNGATRIVMIIRNSNVLQVYRGSTLIASSTQTPTIGQTYLVEVYFKPADSGGKVQVRVNGSLWIDFTGDTTDGPTTINGLRLGHQGDSILYPCYAYFDNIVVDSSQWPGNTRIAAIFPNGAGNSTQWTPSAGQNWDCVDEKPPSGSDYVYTDTANLLDLYALSDLGSSVYAIKSLQIGALAVRQGNSALSLKLACRTGGNNYLSSALSVPFINPKNALWLLETNPATNQPWTKDEVNALEAGIMSV